MADTEGPFVCAYLFDGHGGGRAIGPEDVARPVSELGFHWIHLDLNWQTSRRWLAERSDVSEVIEHALLADETRPRAVLNDDGLLLVLRGINMNPGADRDDMVAIRLWIEPNRVISSRRRKLLSIQDIRNAIAEGAGPTTAGEFVVMLVERLAERIGDFVDTIEESLEQAEAHAADAEIATLRAQVGEFRRETAAIRRYLAPQRDALDRLYRSSGPLFTANELEELREQADRITRYMEDLDLVRERSIVLQEELMNRVANEQNSRVYLLSVVAAIFLPLSFVTGLLGMNVAGLPGTTNPLAFTVSVLLMAALGIGLVVLFKWKKWI
jgi:zinc transporter